MFYRRKLNALINRLHERALGIVFRDFNSSILRRDSSTTLHQRSLQKLMNEMFKVKTGIVPESVRGVFEFADLPYNEESVEM